MSSLSTTVGRCHTSCNARGLKLTSTETSTLWRQEHNGYSHQNPGLINNFITLPRNLARIYFPPDANCSVSTTDHCLRSKNCE